MVLIWACSMRRMQGRASGSPTARRFGTNCRAATPDSTSRPACQARLLLPLPLRTPVSPPAWNWTRWSRFDELRVQFGNGAPDSVTKESWRNTTRVGAGFNYRYNVAWLLRGALSYERSPVLDAFRTPSVPDSSRKILAFGLQYKPTAQSAWDFGVAHIFINDASIDRADLPLNGRLVGTYRNDVNIVSLQYSKAF